MYDWLNDAHVSYLDEPIEDHWTAGTKLWRGLIEVLCAKN